MSEEIELKAPITVKGDARFAMVLPEPERADLSPRLPERSAAAIVQSILAQPAPVPQRDPVTVKRERLDGDNGKSTPIQRAIASMLRSSKYLALVAIAGLVAYVALPTVSGVTITFVTLVAMGVTLLIFDAMEYRHSQPGVERLRTEKDHKLEMAHERNRHAETMTAIHGDIEIKLRVLDLAAGNRKIADRQSAQKRLEG